MVDHRAEGKRARRVAETRARLIDVSLDLYVSQGFSATTVDQIAAAAGIGRSSFFRYFASKEAVLFAPALAPWSWFIDQLDARPTGEPPLRSIAAICIEGPWPPFDRQDILRSRLVLRAEPSLQDAIPTQLSSTSRVLTDRLQERAPDVDPLVVRAIASLTVNWTEVAITGHLADGRPLADHFAEVIGATASLTDDLDAVARTLPG